jgi:hypothetical protein
MIDTIIAGTPMKLNNAGGYAYSQPEASLWSDNKRHFQVTGITIKTT